MKINMTPAILAIGITSALGTNAAFARTSPSASTTAPAATSNYGSGTSSTSSTSSDYGSYSSGGPSKFAIGYRRSASTVPGANMGQISGQVEFKPGMRGGLDLGFISDFDAFLFNAEIQYDLINRGAASLFVEGDAGFFRSSAGAADIKSFVPAVLLGFNYQLTSQLQFSVAYGLQMGFGSGTDGNHVAITNAGDFAGNFAVRWMF